MLDASKNFSKANKNFSQEGTFLQRNLNLKLFSLLIAIALWFYVHSTETSSGVSTFETDINVPVFYRGIPDNMVVTDSASQVILTVRGRRPLVESLVSSDFKAIVNVTAARPGIYNNIPVNVIKPQNINVVSISPKDTWVALKSKK